MAALAGGEDIHNLSQKEFYDKQFIKENSHNNGCLRDLSAGKMGNDEVQKKEIQKQQKKLVIWTKI